MADLLHMVLLAAGSGSRFGGAKQQLTVGGVAMVRCTALAALGVGMPLVVVTGAYAEMVSGALSGLEATLVYNAQWQSGMGTSIACGIDHVSKEVPPSSAAMICLADQPLIDTPIFLKLISDPRRTPDCIVVAQHGTNFGPPCLFPRRYFRELAGLSGPNGARTLLRRYAVNIAAVPVPEAAFDIDTQEDYKRFLVRDPG